MITIQEPAAGFKCRPEAAIPVRVTASDPDRDRVDLRYEIVPNDPSKRFVGDFEQALGVVSSGIVQGPMTLTAPKEPGLYRLQFVARDGKGAACVDSRSFLVE